MKEEVINRSFEDIQLFSRKDGEEINSGKYNFEYALNGHALISEIKGQKVAIFSRFDAENGFIGLDGEYDIFVSMNLTESIEAFYKANKSISYRARMGEVDGEENGTFKYSFN